MGLWNDLLKYDQSQKETSCCNICITCIHSDLWGWDSLFVNIKRFNIQSKGHVLYTVIVEDSSHSWRMTFHTLHKYTWDNSSRMCLIKDYCVLIWFGENKNETKKQKTKNKNKQTNKWQIKEKRSKAQKKTKQKKTEKNKQK